MQRQRSNTLWLVVVNAVYAVVAILGWPVYVALLIARKKYRSRFWERLGLVPRFEGGRKRLWVHAISVGEVEAARTFVPALAEALPEVEIVVSTTTMTGRQRAERLFPDRPVFHFPIDLAPCVLLALRRVRPTAVIQVESEWWPNFFLLAARRGLPVMIVNLRMTDRSQRGYRRIRPLMRTVIDSCAAIGVQAPLYTDRLLGLGARPEHIHATGQMKHDGVGFRDTVEGAGALRRDVKIEPDAPVVVAGSTGPGEEALLLGAYERARKWHPRLRLVIVPRRPESFDRAAEAILAAGHGLLRRSSGEWLGPRLKPPVILGDTMGELMAWYALADVVVLGRSFVPLGGSNPMEPGSLGKPLVWGPEMYNFPVEAPAMVQAGAAIEGADAEALAKTIDDLLTDADKRRQMGEAARRTIRSMQGATQRNVDLVVRTLREQGLREASGRPS